MGRLSPLPRALTQAATRSGCSLRRVLMLPPLWRNDGPAARVHGSQPADRVKVNQWVAVNGEDVGVKAGGDASFVVPEPAGLRCPGGHRLQNLDRAQAGRGEVVGRE